MAQIDVSDILSDPEFSDTITVVKRASSVNGFGENQITETNIDTIGCVQPASGRVIQRLPEALRVANVSSFWVRAELVPADAGAYPCVLIFNGQRFQVQSVLDWTNFGPGWSEGTCVVETPA